MADLFTFEDQIHHRNDVECPGCAEEYPEPCACGGLVHASELPAAEDTEVALTTQCDRCGRAAGEADDTQVA